MDIFVASGQRRNNDWREQIDSYLTFKMFSVIDNEKKLEVKQLLGNWDWHSW